jgi:hypothetical protein
VNNRCFVSITIYVSDSPPTENASSSESKYKTSGSPRKNVFVIMCNITIKVHPSFPDRSEWKKGFQPDRNGELIWFTDGSKTGKGTGAVVCCQGTRRKLSFSFGQHTTVFQAEVYAIKACINQNVDRGYKNMIIYNR